MRIFVIDDSSTSRRMIAKILSTTGMPDAVEEFEDGESGIEALRLDPPDLIVTDLCMPGCSGIDVLVAAKAVSPRTEVIVMTAHASIESAVEAMRRGARDYIEKPVHHDLLLERVDTVRDLIERLDEVEEFRFAKEAVEENASQDLRLMEIQLAAHKSALLEIEEILASSITDEEKCRRVRASIAETPLDPSEGLG
jgi:DNA-binding NtrC family response regulator